jgi:glycosyltransferase involved in cell wall biosynthesis
MTNLEIGAVIIGRNEGKRLVRCIKSLTTQIKNIVYVDSGSTDNSLATAEELGVNTVSLDMSIPFTAARARNAGVESLQNIMPNLEFVQFVDGDCTVQSGWIKSASDFLLKNEDYAVVCGRRRELFPEASIYNTLCDIEWDTPVGDAMACGGDSLMRAEAFQEMGGFNPSVIAGEEPELCFRLREAGWKVFRLDEEMTLHDAAMTKFSQWWKRSVRAGYAFALGFSMHGDSPERYWRKECLRIYFWGISFPLTVVFLSIINSYFIFLVFLYVLQIIKLGLKAGTLAKKWHWSSSIVIGKIPEAIGLMKFKINSLFNQQSRIIEYK